MAKKFDVYEYFKKTYAPDLGFDPAEGYTNPDDTKRKKKRQHDVAKISANEQAQKLENLYKAYNKSTDDVISVGPKTYIEFDKNGDFVVKDKHIQNKYNKEYSNPLSEKTIDSVDTMLSDEKNQTYDMMDIALHSKDLIAKEEAMSKLQKELEYKSEMLKQDKKPNGESLTSEEKELLNTDVDILMNALIHPETIISANSEEFTKRLTNKNKYIENKELVSKVNENLEPDEQNEIINYDKKMRDFKGNISLKKPAVYKFRYKDENGKWVYKLGYETLGGIYNRYKNSKQKNELQILSYYQGSDAQTMEQRYHYLLKKAKVPFAVDKDFGSGYSETYGIDPSLRIHSDEFNRINSGLKSIGQLKLAFDKANVDANVKKEIGLSGSAIGLGKRFLSGATTAIAGTAAGLMDLIYIGDPNKSHQDTNSVWGQASNYLHKLAKESNYVFGIDETAERESYKTFENGIIEWKKGNWGRAFWNWAKSMEQGGLQVTANSLGLVGGIALTSYIPGGLFARGLSVSKNAAQLSSQIFHYGIMEANANIYERYKNNNYKKINDNEKASIYLGSFLNAGLQMGVFHHIVGRNGPVFRSLSGEEIALNEFNNVTQERIKFLIARNFIKRTLPSMAEEAGAEYVETLYDEIAQKLDTEKYIGKNINDIIDNIQHQALYGALMGAASGGLMVSPRSVGEIIASFNDGIYAKLNTKEFISERVHDAIEGMDTQTKILFDKKLKTGIETQEAGIENINTLLQKDPDKVIDILGKTILETKTPEKQELIDVYNQIVAKNLMSKIYGQLAPKNFNVTLSESNGIKNVGSHIQNFFNSFSSNEADQNILLAKVKKVLAENDDIVLGIENDDFTKDPVGSLNKKIEEAIQNKDSGTLKQFIALTQELNKEFTESEYSDIRQELKKSIIGIITEYAKTNDDTIKSSLNNLIKQELVLHKTKTENGIKVQNKILEISSQYEGQESKNVSAKAYAKMNENDIRKLTDTDLINIHNQLNESLNSENENIRNSAERIMKKLQKQIEYRKIGNKFINDGLSKLGTINELTTNEGKKNIYKEWQKSRYKDNKDKYEFASNLTGKDINKEINDIIDISFSNENENSKTDKLKQKIYDLKKIYNKKSKGLNEEDKKKLKFALIIEPEIYVTNNLFKDIINNKEFNNIKDENVKKQFINKEIVKKVNEENFDFYKEILTDFTLNKDELGSTIEENDLQSIFKFIKDNSEAFKALLEAKTYEDFKKDYIEVNKEAIETGFNTKKGEHRAGVKEYNDFTDVMDSMSIENIEHNNDNLLRFIASRSINKISEWGKLLRKQEKISTNVIIKVLNENKKIIAASILRTNKIAEIIKNTDNEEDKKKLVEQIKSIKITRYLLPYVNANGEIVVMDRYGNEKSIGKNIKSIRNSSIGLIKAYRDALSQSHQELKDALSETGYGDEEVFNKIINAFGKKQFKESNNNSKTNQNTKQTKEQQQKKHIIKLNTNSKIYNENKEDIDKILEEIKNTPFTDKSSFIKPNLMVQIMNRKKGENEYKVNIFYRDKGSDEIKLLTLLVRDNNSKYKNNIIVFNFKKININKINNDLFSKSKDDLKNDEEFKDIISTIVSSSNTMFENSIDVNSLKTTGKDGKEYFAKLPFINASTEVKDEQGNKKEMSHVYSLFIKTNQSTIRRIDYDFDKNGFYIKNIITVFESDEIKDKDFVNSRIYERLLHIFGSEDDVKNVFKNMMVFPKGDQKFDPFFSAPTNFDFVSNFDNELTNHLLWKVKNIGKEFTQYQNQGVTKQKNAQQQVSTKTNKKTKSESKKDKSKTEPKEENKQEIERNRQKIDRRFEDGLTDYTDTLENIYKDLELSEEIDIDTSIQDIEYNGEEDLVLTSELKDLINKIDKKQSEYMQTYLSILDLTNMNPNQSIKDLRKAYANIIRNTPEIKENNKLKKELVDKLNDLMKEFRDYSLGETKNSKVSKDEIYIFKNSLKSIVWFNDDSTIEPRKKLRNSIKDKLNKEYIQDFNDIINNIENITKGVIGTNDKNEKIYQTLDTTKESLNNSINKLRELKKKIDKNEKCK